MLSMIAALTAILDTCALVISGADGACVRQARLTFAMCRHAVVDLAQVFSAAPESGNTDRLPPPDLQRVRSTLATAGLNLHDTPESRKKLATLRGMYEPYIQALSKYLYMDLPPWILAKEIADNWKTSAWGRISGLTGGSRSDPLLDDHSD